MTDMGQKEFVLWYLESQGYEKTLEKLKKSLEIEPTKKISKKKIKKFEKIKNEIIAEPKTKEPLLNLVIKYYSVWFYFE